MFCKKCGTEQKIGDKFCRKCGTPFLTSYDNEATYPANNLPFVVTEDSIIDSSKKNAVKEEDDKTIISIVDSLKDNKINYKKFVLYLLMALCVSWGIKHFADNNSYNLNKLYSGMSIINGGSSSIIEKFNESLSGKNVIYTTPIYYKFYSVGYMMGYDEIDSEVLADKKQSRNLALMFFPISKTEGKVTLVSYSLDFRSYNNSSVGIFRYYIKDNEILIHSGTPGQSDMSNPQDIRLKMSFSPDGGVQLTGMCKKRERVFTDMLADFDIKEWEYDY